MQVPINYDKTIEGKYEMLVDLTGLSIKSEVWKLIKSHFYKIVQMQYTRKGQALPDKS